jgi:hypothetical protein
VVTIKMRTWRTRPQDQEDQEDDVSLSVFRLTPMLGEWSEIVEHASGRLNAL